MLLSLDPSLPLNSADKHAHTAAHLNATNTIQQNTKHNWDAPEQFRPERWLDVPVETYVFNAKAGPGADGAHHRTSDDGCSAGGARATTGGGAAPTPSKLAAAAAASKEGITFMPFSDGPRSCVGQSLAKMEVITLLAKIFGCFTLKLAPEMGGLEGVRARESTHLTLQTKGTKGIRMNMAPRSEHVAAGRVVAAAAAAPS